MTWQDLTAYGLAILYALAGISHWLRPRFFARLIPMWMPSHQFLVAASGLLEVVLAVALFIPAIRQEAAWASAALLTLYLPIHVVMLLQPEDTGMGLPRWALLLRLLLQFVLIGLSVYAAGGLGIDTTP